MSPGPPPPRPTRRPPRPPPGKPAPRKRALAPRQASPASGGVKHEGPDEFVGLGFDVDAAGASGEEEDNISLLPSDPPALPAGVHPPAPADEVRPAIEADDAEPLLPSEKEGDQDNLVQRIGTGAGTEATSRVARCVDSAHRFLQKMLDVAQKEHAWLDPGQAGQHHYGQFSPTTLVLPLLFVAMAVLAAAMVFLRDSEAGRTDDTVFVFVWASAGVIFLVLVVALILEGRQRGELKFSAQKQAKRMKCLGQLWVLTWSYMVALFLLPASLMSNGGNSTANASGGYLFVLLLWMSGWVYMWIFKSSIHKVNDDAIMATVPDALPFRLRLVSVVYEGYTACGFTFFPAMPWADTSIVSASHINTRARLLLDKSPTFLCNHA